MSNKRIYNVDLVVLTFTGGLTLLMSRNQINRPLINGYAKLGLHRKFLPEHHKFIHWINFDFMENSFKFAAQIMLSTRLQAGCTMIEEGQQSNTCCCFLNNPTIRERRCQQIRRKLLASRKL